MAALFLARRPGTLSEEGAPVTGNGSKRRGRVVTRDALATLRERQTRGPGREPKRPGGCQGSCDRSTEDMASDWTGQVASGLKLALTRLSVCPVSVARSSRTTRARGSIRTRLSGRTTRSGASVERARQALHRIEGVTRHASAQKFVGSALTAPETHQECPRYAPRNHAGGPIGLARLPGSPCSSRPRRRHTESLLALEAGELVRVRRNRGASPVPE